MEPKIGINKENISKVAHALSIILADEYILYTKTRNAHWNLEGPDFHSKHRFFDGQNEELDEIVDSVAERIRSLGHYAPASLKQFLQLTHFSEHSEQKNDSLGYIRELLNDHESMIDHLRENINYFAIELKDLGSSDFVTGLMGNHEKMAWMLRAHL